MKQCTKEGIYCTLFIAAMISGLVAAIWFGAEHEEAREQRKASQHKASARAQFEQEAVAHGAGSYVITDPKTGATEFQWRDKTD